MEYLDKTSLFKTVDNVSEALLFQFKIAEKEKLKIAGFIAGRQGKTNAYANTFAATESDLKHDLTLFTGEKIKSNAGRTHMIGEEASRILRKLNVDNDDVKAALQKADNGLRSQIETILNDPKYAARYEPGMYCCKTCSCALWLNLSSGGLYDDTKFLAAGMQYLKKHRDGNGRWKGFPYYYTLYVLNEIHPDFAMDEMKYTALSIERILKRKKSEKNKYDLRRNYIYAEILGKIA